MPDTDSPYISPCCVPDFAAWLVNIARCYGLYEKRVPEHIQRPGVLWQVVVNHFAKLLLLRTDLRPFVDSEKNPLLQPKHVAHAVGSIYTCVLVRLCVPGCIFFFTSKLMPVENSFHRLEAIWQISAVR